ncbi:DUF1800 domain-containing protein [Candidatus Leptofilum sp.]|uniref:DUF1800 domain-containing protein n=1 Tax=Candidatus Leptofilum sp. TaxID=3241576 RepID=UPI003B5A75A8
MALSRRDLFLGNFLQAKTAVATIPPITTDPTFHFLQRISYGPRPADVRRARQIGIEAYLDEQLHPEQIEDAEANGRLRNLPLLNMDRHTLHQLSNSEYRSQRALTEGMLVRAVYSKRQLLERMVEFWADHFNISGDEYTRDLLVFQREAIRANALGSFRDLLFAVAKSPAMLHYLDNYLNVAEAPNENYARELMELHTLGVDGGYTEADVKAVARAFTGWTTHNGTRTGFYFDPTTHDTDPKQVLGHSLPGNRGIEDGLHVLNILTEHPATARFICTKLCIRFVRDTPPVSLVDRLTAVWQQTSGDIKIVLRTLFLSDEFFNSAGQKFRRPLDVFIGALRATGTQITQWWRLEEMIYALGQPPYGWPAPNGYPDVAVAWQSSGGLLARWNVAMTLTHGAYEDIYDDGYGLTTNLHQRIGQPETVSQLVDAVAEQVLGAPLAGEARADFIDYVMDGVGDGETAVTPHLLARKLATLFGLMLASPAFQWR